MEKGASSNIHLQKKQRREDKIRSAMLDFDVLECPFCFEPLTSPIFQCENGHLACSSCCAQQMNKCPTCASRLGHIRNRAMESVVESVFLPCSNAKFGCTVQLSYGREANHEKECTFSSCSCPVQYCDYSGSYNDLYSHYTSIHEITGVPFRINCDKFHSVGMNISDKILIMTEVEERLLFAVQCFREPSGVCVTVSCIAPSAPELGTFSYHLSYIVDGHIVSYKSPEVKRILKVSFETPQEGFMLIPNHLLRGELSEYLFVSIS